MKGEGAIEGRRVAITGRMAAMTRPEVEALVRERGGIVEDAVTRRTEILVVGAEGIPLAEDGAPSRKLRRARERIEGGAPLEILSEDAFLERLGLGRAPEERPLYTTTQLSRILGVPGRRIRAWVRRGLVSPARTTHRLQLFDFRQVAALRSVASLVEAGVAPERLARSLAELRAWLPEVDGPVRRLEALGPDLLVRLEDGALAEPTGQLRFGFGEGTGGEVLPAADPFQEGLRREDEGDLEGAAAAYERAIRAGDDDPETAFNLGNVLHALGRTADATSAFRRAVEAEPSYVEAWNNLGNALADGGETEGALRAFRRALAVEPAYADAHLNLAETLHAAGRTPEARGHWRAYLASDATSEWAELARRRLGGRGASG
jgi:tetratricopeptide (TPR) repeat protein